MRVAKREEEQSPEARHQKCTEMTAQPSSREWKIINNYSQNAPEHFDVHSEILP
jgi:hypothetical protein